MKSRSVIFLSGVLLLASGCGVYSANNLKAASPVLANEDFTTYVARHLKGHLGYRTNGKIYTPDVAVISDEGRQALESYLTTYCSQRGGKVEAEDDYNIKRHILSGGGDGFLDICTARNGEFMGGIAYNYNYRVGIVERFFVISPQDWSEVAGKVAGDKENEMKNEKQRLQEEREQQALDIIYK